MISDKVQKMIPEIRKYLSSQPVERAWLFGSCSRGEETADSDVDILVHYKEGEKVSLFMISKIMITLGKILDCRVDVVEDDGLMPFAKECVDKDKILIYERGNEIHSLTQSCKLCSINPYDYWEDLLANAKDPNRTIDSFMPHLWHKA